MFSQGPFRDPREVQKQRYKQFQPSLRVATDYFSVDKARQSMKDEEWVTRFNDTRFVHCLDGGEVGGGVLTGGADYIWGGQLRGEEWVTRFNDKRCVHDSGCHGGGGKGGGGGVRLRGGLKATSGCERWDEYTVEINIVVII